MTYFRRSHFPMVPNRQPLWHWLVRAENHVFTAVCGYTFTFISEEPMLRESVRTTKLRCSKCDAKAEVTSQR